ncbi:MAG: PAS domain S-box protein [Desulfobacterales bacterium]|jgi:two-component system, cell cycle sensor histidine kinase and response regulator CckA|nr:PAS domain S-box protein [Desulfobacteraceae bacterium]MBT7085840.1 PAS domain S-box protein [Desulfobacterales bacterium]
MEDKPTYGELDYKVKVLEKEAVWRRQAENALKESEENFRLLAEGLKDVVLRITPRGMLEYCSPAIKKFGGYDPEKEIGNNVKKYFVNENEYYDIMKIVEENLIDNLAQIFQFLFKPKDKEAFYVEVSGKIIHRKDNTYIIQCVLRNISRRKKAEQELLKANERLEKEVEERTKEFKEIIIRLQDEIAERENSEKALREKEKSYKTILESIEEGYFEVDLYGNFTFINNSMCNILGIPKSEILGVNTRDFSNDETVEKVTKIFSKVYNSRETDKRFGLKINLRNGSIKKINSSLSLILDSKNRPSGFRGIIREVADIK